MTAEVMARVLREIAEQLSKDPPVLLIDQINVKATCTDSLYYRADVSYTWCPNTIPITLEVKQ